MLLSKCRASIAVLVPVCFPTSPPSRLRKLIFIHLSVRVQVALPDLKWPKFTTNPATVIAPTGFGEHMQNVQQGQSGAQLMPWYIPTQIAQRAASNQQPVIGGGMGSFSGASNSLSQLRLYSGQSALGGYDEASTQDRSKDSEQWGPEGVNDPYLTTVSSNCVVMTLPVY